MTKNFKIIKWAILNLYQSLPKLVVGLVVVQVLISTIPFLENYYFSKIIDSLTYPDSLKNLIIINLSVLIGIRFVKSLVRNTQRYLNRVFYFSVDTFLRQQFVFKISSLDYQHLEDKDTANLIAKVKDEYQWRFRETFSVIFDSVIQISGFVTSALILSKNYWYILVLIMLSQIPTYFVDKNFVKSSFKFFNENTLKNRQVENLGSYLTTKKYLSELKITDSIKYLQQKFLDLQNFFLFGRIRLRNEKLPRDYIADVISLIAMSIGLLIVISDIRTGLLTVGMFTFYFNVLRQTGDFFSGFINDMTNLSEHVLHIGNYKQILELEPKIMNRSLHKLDSKVPLIEFKNVSFKYPNSKRYVYKNLNLTIQPGEEIAIVGANGVGKSTLIKLLCRFYDPSNGDIFVNNTNLKDIDIDHWHQQLSVLFQEFTTYSSLNLEENIKISSPYTKSKKSELKSALKKADAESFVSKYHDGLNTPMSVQFGGEEPSWGQWQKIAISRIFYRNSPIMILDEPTASIDAVSESKIFDNLYKKITGKTVIIVSHRFSTVRNAKRIIVIDDGQIIEEGTHDQLLKLKGKYANSFNLQAQGYQDNSASTV